MGSISDVIRAIRDWSKSKFAPERVEIKNYRPFFTPPGNCVSNGGIHNTIYSDTTLEDYPEGPYLFKDDTSTFYELLYTLENGVYSFSSGSGFSGELTDCPLELNYVYDYENIQKDPNGKIIPSVKKIIVKNNSDNIYKLPKSFGFVAAQLRNSYNNNFLSISESKEIKSGLTCEEFYFKTENLEGKIYNSDLMNYLHSGILTSDVIKNKIMITGCPENGGLDSYMTFITHYNNDYSCVDIFKTILDYYNTGYFGKGYLETYDSNKTWNSRLLGFDTGRTTSFSEGFTKFNENELLPYDYDYINLFIYLSKEYEWQPNEELVFEPKLFITDTNEEYFSTVTLNNENIYYMTLTDHVDINKNINSIKNSINTINSSLKVSRQINNNSLVSYYRANGNPDVDTNYDSYRDYSNTMDLLNATPNWSDEIGTSYSDDKLVSDSESYYNWSEEEIHAVLKYPNNTNMINIPEETTLLNMNRGITDYTIAKENINQRPFVRLKGTSSTSEEIVLSEFYIPANFFNFYPDVTFNAQFSILDESTGDYLYTEYPKGGSYKLYEKASAYDDYELIAEITSSSSSIKLSTIHENNSQVLSWKVTYATEPNVNYSYIEDEVDKGLLVMASIFNEASNSPMSMILPAVKAFTPSREISIDTIQEYITSNEEFGLNPFNDKLIIPQNLSLTFTLMNGINTAYIDSENYYYVNKTDSLINIPYKLSSMTMAQAGSWSTIKMTRFYITGIEVDTTNYNLIFPVLFDFKYKTKRSTTYQFASKVME